MGDFDVVRELVEKYKNYRDNYNYPATLALENDHTNIVNFFSY